ncbi:MAG: hypothetical protein PHX99_06405 [Synergistaceae bacterium]|jgi:tRNA nucleotidyltransferase (CCA-adding enzyme)|nr:hypothetical protein [Synergistaceae bacterium]
MMTEIEFLRKVTEIGGTAYVAGGWVRDRLMGRCPHDKDYVVCGINENNFTSGFPDAQKTGNSFPVFILYIDGRPCDVAMARTEKKKGIGYKGFVVEYGPDVKIEEDLFRRDTTINSIAWSPEEDKLIDPFGGQTDIKGKKIRATSDHFCEDPVRALRAARQAAEFDFTIEMRTLEMMECCGPELLYEPKERIFGELKRAMMSDRPSIFFSMLAEAGVIAAVILPLGEIWKRQSEDGGEDFSYAMSLLDKTAKLCQRPEVRFASLVRSIGLSLEGREDLLDEIDRTLRLPGVWRRCAEFASLHLPEPATGKAPAVAVDTLTKLQNHPIGIDGCIAITKAEGTIDSYPFLENSEMYLDVMKKARAELPAGIERKARGEWIRARQIEAVSKLIL